MSTAAHGVSGRCLLQTLAPSMFIFVLFSFIEWSFFAKAVKVINREVCVVIRTNIPVLV